MIDCPSCGSTHMGVDCGGSFRDRLLSVRLDTSAVETRSRHEYFDAEAVDASFGEDSRERYLEETQGRGAGVRGPDGELYQRDRESGELVPMTEEMARDTYLRGPEVEEVA